MELVKKAEKLLKQAFPRPDKVKLKDEDGITGVVTSARFRGMSSLDRQELIWDALDRNLTPEERRKIVIVIAVSPEEEIAHTS
jgi:stress-induced morphogen